MESVDTLKRNLRVQCKQKLAQLSHQQRADAAQAASQLLIESDLWKQSKTLLLFLSTPEELGTQPLLMVAQRQFKCVALPRIAFDSSQLQARLFIPGDALVANRWGIEEPSAEAVRMDFAKIDLILVPGLGFDRQGNRLGRGKGYYDKLLVSRSPHCRAVGYFFACQELMEIPTEPHDQRLDAVVTEREMASFSS